MNIKLTNKEYNILINYKDKDKHCIARDADNDLWIWDGIDIFKYKDVWKSKFSIDADFIESVDSGLFKFIKWSDEKPYLVSDILKMNENKITLTEVEKIILIDLNSTGYLNICRSEDDLTATLLKADEVEKTEVLGWECRKEKFDSPYKGETECWRSLNKNRFKFIKESDDKPWSIQSLLDSVKRKKELCFTVDDKLSEIYGQDRKRLNTNRQETLQAKSFPKLIDMDNLYVGYDPLGLYSK